MNGPTGLHVGIAEVGDADRGLRVVGLGHKEVGVIVCGSFR
jgi:hypothetical protein